MLANPIKLVFQKLIDYNSYQKYQDYNLVRQTRVSSTQDSSVTLKSKHW